MCAMLTTADLLVPAVLWVGGSCAAYGVVGSVLAAVGRRRGHDRLHVAGRVVVSGAVGTVVLFAGLLALAVLLSPAGDAAVPIVLWTTGLVIGAPALPAVLGLGYYLLFDDPRVVPA